MTCSVPGCQHTPKHSERVRAERHASLDHLPMRRKPDLDEPEIPPTQAQTDLCDLHRAEFEALGWLVPAENDDD